MTDDIIPDGHPDPLGYVAERLQELEQRVDELEASASTTRSGGVGELDRYDAHVLTRIEEIGAEPSPRKIVELYHEAGIRDTRKIKDRHKFLRRSGRIEQAVENGTDTEG